MPSPEALREAMDWRMREVITLNKHLPRYSRYNAVAIALTQGSDQKTYMENCA